MPNPPIWITYGVLLINEFTTGVKILQMNILNKSVWKLHTDQTKARCILGKAALKSLSKHICITVIMGFFNDVYLDIKGHTSDNNRQTQDWLKKKTIDLLIDNFTGQVDYIQGMKLNWYFIISIIGALTLDSTSITVLPRGIWPK